MKDFWKMVKVCGIVSVFLDPIGGTIGCLILQHQLKNQTEEIVKEYVTMEL